MKWVEVEVKGVNCPKCKKAMIAIPQFEGMLAYCLKCKKYWSYTHREKSYIIITDEL